MKFPPSIKLDPLITFNIIHTHNQSHAYIQHVRIFFSANTPIDVIITYIQSDS